MESDRRLDRAKDSNGHTWAIDEDGVCEYDQGYLCPCGARKMVMAEGDTKADEKAGQPCRVEAAMEEANNWGGMGGFEYPEL
jgi:hypothetical protein